MPTLLPYHLLRTKSTDVHDITVFDANERIARMVYNRMRQRQHTTGRSFGYVTISYRHRVYWVLSAKKDDRTLYCALPAKAKRHAVGSPGVATVKLSANDPYVALKLRNYMASAVEGIADKVQRSEGALGLRIRIETIMRQPGASGADISIAIA
jgi:hypothetical protein